MYVEVTAAVRRGCTRKADGMSTMVSHGHATIWQSHTRLFVNAESSSSLKREVLAAFLKTGFLESMINYEACVVETLSPAESIGSMSRNKSGKFGRANVSSARSR